MVIHVTRSAVALGAALGLAAVVTACSTGATTGTTTGTGSGTPAAAVSFKTDVAPLLSSSCAGCHTQGGLGSSDLVMFDAGGAVNYGNVKTAIGNMIRQTQSGRMPQGRPKLSAEQIAILTNWQAAGTPDN